MRQKALGKVGWRDPVQVLAGLTGRDLLVGLLSDGLGQRGRWSYIAAEPSEILQIAPGDPRDAFAALDACLGPIDAPQPAPDPDLPPFQGGLVGLASYELGARAEPVVLPRADPWPDVICGRYDGLLAFDHHDQAVWAIGVGAQSRALAAKAPAWLGLPPRPGV